MIHKYAGSDLGEGTGGAYPPPPLDDLRLSNTTGILTKKCGLLALVTPFFNGAPPPKKNPGSAPDVCCVINHVYMHNFRTIIEATEKLKQ